jgi:hypothetical protein
MDEEAQHLWVESQMPREELGGPGYTILKDPMRGPEFVEFCRIHSDRASRPLPLFASANSDHTCPKCHGWGVSHPILHDTRYLSRGAAQLYLGLEQTKDGFRIKTRNVEEIYTHLAKTMGYFIERKVILVAGVEQMTEQELLEKSKILDAEYEELLAGSGSKTDPTDGYQPHGDSERGVPA